MNRKKLYVSTIDEQAHTLAMEYGLGLELAEFCTASNLDELFHKKDTMVRSKLKYTDRLTMHGPFSELFPCAVDPMIRGVAARRYRQTIAVAQHYGISKIIFHGGYDPHLYFPCWYLEQSILFWKDFLSELPDNMVICLENVLEETPDMLADIIRQVNSPKLRMCLDVGHAHAYSKCTVHEWVSSCNDVISHFHIHNNDGSWDTHSALNAGTIDMPTLLHEIDTNCPQASVTMELMDAASSIRWLMEQHILEVETWNCVH